MSAPETPAEAPRVALQQSDLDTAVACANRHLEPEQRKGRRVPGPGPFQSINEQWAVLRFAAWALLALQDAGVIGLSDEQAGEAPQCPLTGS